MATWEPYLDINNDSYRPLHFTATAVAIAKGAIVLADQASAIRVPASPFFDECILGIAAEAIAASGTGLVYTSGIFYSSTGGGATINPWDHVTGASASTLMVAETTEDIWGLAMGSAVSAAGVFGTNIASAGAAYFYLNSQMDVGFNNPFAS
jgi:hypothetical protein